MRLTVIGSHNPLRACGVPKSKQGSGSILPCRRRLFSQLSVFTAALMLSASLPAAAQNTQARPRITQGIDDNRLTVLQGHVHPLARPQSDRGPADPSLKLERITLMFKPSPEQQADLDSLLAQQQDPSSLNFHKWLTPEEFGARFGVAQSDISQVVAWLEREGLTVVETARSRNWVAFSGTAAQVQSALHTEIHNYALNGKTYFANSGEPAVPAALAGLVLGFRGLNNFPLKAHNLKSKAASGAVEPNFTSSITGNHFLAPDDFATIYDLKPLYNSGINGSGQKIAVMGQSNIVLADIANFRSNSGLAANAPQVISVGPNPPGVVDGDVQEASLDIEWSGAVAPNATIIYVYSSNALNSLVSAINSDLAPVMSISYGACEKQFTANDPLVTLAQQANAQGITIVAASGDGGAADCDGDTNTDPATQGLAVDFPASIPNVTGVGGTEFIQADGNFWNPGNNSANGSATMYIPEVAWNDTPGSNPPMLFASGGGASTLFPKPSWQAGAGVPSDNARDVPDVSFNGSPNHDPYLVCTQIHPTPGAPLTSSCQNGFRNSTSDPNLSAFGGTSFGAPTFAGIVALINQFWGSSGQGNVNPTLYALATRMPSAFHDITTGNNDVPCAAGSPAPCPANGGTIGFNAGIGYDQVTGLGTNDGFNLVSNWSATPVLSASPSSQSVNAGASATYQITDNSGITYALSCSGLPAGASCGAVSVNGNSTAQLVISTTARGAAPPSSPETRQPYWGQKPGIVLGPLALLLLCFTVAGMRRKSALVPMGAFVFLFAMLLFGCGSGSTGSGGGSTGTPAGSYTITVNGTSGSTIQSTTLTLQVN